MTFESSNPARQRLIAKITQAAIDYESDTAEDRRVPLFKQANAAVQEYMHLARGDLVVSSSDPDFETKLEQRDPRRGAAVILGDEPIPDDVSAIASEVFEAVSRRLDIAGELGVLPAGFAERSPLEAARWLDAETRVEPPLAEEIAGALKRASWRYVFHVTTASRLVELGRFGIVDGGLVDLLEADPPGQGDRRPHGDAEKQDLLHHRVFTGFWPAWWLFQPSHYGGSEAVILAIDSEAVCLQRGCAFVDRAISSADVTGEELRSAANTSPEGPSAWRRCWEGGQPKKKAEIVSARIHPAHIRKVLFATGAARERWWPAFRSSFEAAYPNLQIPEPAGPRIANGGTWMGFSPKYLQATTARSEA